MVIKRLLILNFKFAIALILIIPLLSSASIFSERMKKPDTYFLQKSITDLTSPHLLKKNLNEFLLKTFPGRSYRMAGHQKLEDFFAEFELENEIKFQRQVFTPNSKWAQENLRREFDEKVAKNFPRTSPVYKKWERFLKELDGEYDSIQKNKFTNYIYLKNGTSNLKTLIISANIDSIGQDPKSKKILHNGYFFGANDNASSIISLLELIKVINKIDLPFNVMAVFFDLQEFGNLGSYAFVSEYLKSGGNANYIHVNSLMLSKLNSSKEKKQFKLFGKSNPAFNPNFVDKVSTLVAEAKIIRVEENYAGSDSGPFHDYSIPSLTLMGLTDDDQGEVIHQVSDSVESIDFYHYNLGTKVLFSLVLNLLYPL